MVSFVINNLPAGFPIQKQYRPDACITASACSLIEAQGGLAPTQSDLHPLVLAAMNTGLNGFDALSGALAFLNSPCCVTRYTPTGPNLVAWFYNHQSTYQGFLLSTQMGGVAHCTVIFHDKAGTWYQADPWQPTVCHVHLATLQGNYGGDVATIG